MDLITIKSPEYRRLNNAEHVQYHVNVRNAVEDAGTDAIGLNLVAFSPYTQAISVEQDVVNRASGSAFTLEMEEADRLRDLIFRRIRQKLGLCELETEGSISALAAPVVKKNLLAKYPGSVTILPYQEETAHLAGLILDCRNLLSEEQRDAIGIEADLTALEEANNSFEQHYQGRVTEKAEGNAMLSAKLRATTDEAYALLVLTLNQLANDPTPANQEKVAACRTLIGKINVIANDAKNRLNQRLNNGTSDEETDEENNGSDGDGSKPNTGSGTGSGSGTGTGSGNSKPGGLIIPDEVIE